MPTANPRINLTLDNSLASMLSILAKQEQKTVPSLIKELIFEALERREDVAFSAIAEYRDKKGIKTVEHEDAWK